MPSTNPERRLTLFDSTSIIVGIIIGAGIYESTPVIANCVAAPGMLLLAFALGGLITLIGALCYAELATAYPREGGDYVFLTRGLGRRTGFLFAWSEFWIVRPGNIGAMAYVFARYAGELLPLQTGSDLLVYALGSVGVLTVVNVLGVQTGKWTQNVLSTIKVAGLFAVFAIGLWVTFAHEAPTKKIAPPWEDGFRLAMILVLFTYGGWNEISYVAAEVRDPRRNILRALVLGTLAVTSIYLVVNAAFVGALGFQGVRETDALASDVLRIALGERGAAAISLLICISCLGAINGMIFTGARVYYALGQEHRLYAWLGRWNRTLQTPIRSLVLQGMVTMLLTAFFYMAVGEDAFTHLVAFTAPLFWCFLLLVGISFFVLRRRDAAIPRPFRVPMYPASPLLFCASSLFMLHAATTYAMRQTIGLRPWYLHFEALWPVGMMLLGLGLSFVDPPVEERSRK